MPKSKKDLSMAMAGQESFLDKISPAEPESLNISLRLRDALSNALRKCKQSRYQIAAQMSELTGCDISKTMLDAYTADSKEYHRFPAEWIPAFKKTTGDDSVLKILAEGCESQIVSGKDLLYAEAARIDRQIEDLKRKQTIIRNRLG